MQSRMDKYQTSDKKRYERTRKNTKLYEEVYDDIYRDTTYRNMKVIDSAKEININKLKNILDDKYDTRQYRTLRNYSVDDLEDEKLDFNKSRQKIYDINEIINEAKSKRAFIEEAKEKQKYIDFMERRNKKTVEYDDMEKEEEELEELINTMAVSSDDNDDLDMFSDLKGKEDTIVTNPIETSFEVSNTLPSEAKKKKDNNVTADKTFYTDSNMFTKNDFEDFSTLTKELVKTKRMKKSIIIIIILIVLAVIFYLLISKYVI